MKKLFLLLITFAVSSCAFVEPSMFIIQNNSNYTITAQVDNTDKTVMIKKNKSEIIILPPQQISLTIAIDEINFCKTERFNLTYLEKKKIDFNLK